MGTIAVHAERDPNRVAVIVGNGDFVETFGELEQRWRSSFARHGARSYSSSSAVPFEDIAAPLLA